MYAMYAAGFIMRKQALRMPELPPVQNGQMFLKILFALSAALAKTVFQKHELNEDWRIRNDAKILYM